MDQGAVVSRNDLFGYSEDEHRVEGPVLINPLFDFVEVDVENDQSGNESNNEFEHEATEIQNDNPDAGLSEFQLFAGSGPTSVNLNQPKEIEHKGRPLEYYIFKSSPSKRQAYESTAVSGDSVIEEAVFWQQLFDKRPIAPDVNQDYVPKKRKCRPGKQARTNRLLKNKRLEQERREAQERSKNRRRKGFQFNRKPRR